MTIPIDAKARDVRSHARNVRSVSEIVRICVFAQSGGCYRREELKFVQESRHVLDSDVGAGGMK